MANLSGGNTVLKADWKPVRPALQLKYYIHDSVQELRFQLIGTLSEVNVPELSGCWNTARTIRGVRRLVIDLRALQSSDEAGKQWLLSLAHEGAEYLPESYFRDGLASQEDDAQSRKLGIVSRLLSILRGRSITAESTTRAQ